MSWLKIASLRSFPLTVSNSYSRSNFFRSFSIRSRLCLEETIDDIVLRKTLTANKLAEDEYIRCTIFDSKGNIVHHGRDIKRSQFMKTYNLVPRDFRKISRHHHADSLNAINVDIVPSIFTRSDSILLNLLNIRALIKHDRVIIFDSFGGSSGSGLNESHSHGLFLKAIQEKLKYISDKEPYEFRALESILIHVSNNLAIEMNVHKTVLQNILIGLEKSIERVKLRYLLIQSKKIRQFHQKSLLIRDLLDDILHQDDELNALYLTDNFNGIPRQATNHTEAELLLESYYSNCDEIVQTVENLRSQIKTSEEIINTILDSNRNELMLLGLKFSCGLLSMGFIIYLSALYGMNIENFIEEKSGGFESVVIIGCVSLVILLIFSSRKVSKLQKVTMTGGFARKKLENLKNLK